MPPDPEISRDVGEMTLATTAIHIKTRFTLGCDEIGRETVSESPMAQHVNPNCQCHLNCFLQTLPARQQNSIACCNGTVGEAFVYLEKWSVDAADNHLEQARSSRNDGCRWQWVSLSLQSSLL